MNGTFGGGDLISASLAIMLGGGADAELHEKSVFFTLNMITTSETGIFEYDPQDEPPSGRPPGPWDGYDFFTVDLSTVKDNIEDMLARIAALEDELEACHDCRDEVVAALQRYDPDYDPAEGECPSDKVDEVVDEVEACHDCKDAVVAAIQQYVPSFTPDPSTCNIPDGVDDVYQQGKDDEADENPPGFTFPPDDPNNPDPDRYDKIAELVGSDNLTDNDLHIIVKPMDDRYPITSQGRHNVYYGFYDSVTGAFLDRTQAFNGNLDLEHTDYVTGFRITDPSTGAYTFDWVTWGYLYNPPTYGWKRYTYTGANQNLIGYGDPTHSYTATNKKNS